MGLNSKNVRGIHLSTSDVSNKAREEISGGQLIQAAELADKEISMQTCQILNLNLTYIKVKYIILNDLFVQPGLGNTFDILKNFSYLLSEKFQFQSH